MAVKEIQAKSILRKHKRVDSWFISCYGMNFYRGCTHNCVYCDGRAEKYNVDGEFGQDVSVKVNAIDVLRKEISPVRRRAPLKKCYFMIGGGVGDSYQPVEEKYLLTRRALSLMYEFNYPVSILTKSNLIERDLEIIKKINEKSRAIVSMSFSSVDDKISSVFEPGVPSPSQRLEALEKFKKEGISCGMFLMPVIPFITDKPKYLDESLKKAKEIGLDFVIFSGMTLKDGRQMEFFHNVLDKYDKSLKVDYQHLYGNNQWGSPKQEYYISLHQTFKVIAKKYGIPLRIPPKLYRDILEENDLVSVILDQIDYMLKSQGKKSPYGFASYSISQLKEPLSSLKSKLRTIKGVGTVTERIILEILETKRSTYHEKLLLM
jgi:DNA repair photolyase